MFILRKFIVGVAVASVAAPSTARSFSGKIEHLMTWHDGHSTIKIQNSPAHSCTNQLYYSLGIKGQDAKAEPMLSMALAAYMANRTVAITTVDGSCQYGHEEKITNFQILVN